MANATVTMAHALSTSTASTDSSAGPIKPAINAGSLAPALAAHDPTKLPVRRLGKADLHRAANCLASAFAHDEVARYFTHNLGEGAPALTQAQTWALHCSVMRYIVRAHLLRGLVVGIGKATTSSNSRVRSGCKVISNPDADEAFDAVALFMPPGANMDDVCTMLRSGLWRLRYQLSREGRRRFFGEFFPLLHETKLNVFGSAERDAASWYLVYLGARPGARGKGLAGRLVRHVTEGKCDPEARDCYLESSNKANLPLYGRLGFRVVRSIQMTRIRGRTVEMDIMVRSPMTQRAGDDIGHDNVNEKSEKKQ